MGFAAPENLDGSICLVYERNKHSTALTVWFQTFTLYRIPPSYLLNHRKSSQTMLCFQRHVLNSHSYALSIVVSILSFNPFCQPPRHQPSSRKPYKAELARSIEEASSSETHRGFRRPPSWRSQNSIYKFMVERIPSTYGDLISFALESADIPTHSFSSELVKLSLWAIMTVKKPYFYRVSGVHLARAPVLRKLSDFEHDDVNPFWGSISKF